MNREKELVGVRTIIGQMALGTFLLLLYLASVPRSPQLINQIGAIGFLMGWAFLLLALVVNEVYRRWQRDPVVNSSEGPTVPEEAGTGEDPVPPESELPRPGVRVRAEAEREARRWGIPVSEALLVRYLSLRLGLRAAYWDDPYAGKKGNLEDDYRPADLLLRRHVYEKLTDWAEDNRLSVSDAAERLLLDGLVDGHLAQIMRNEWFGVEE